MIQLDVFHQNLKLTTGFDTFLAVQLYLIFSCINIYSCINIFLWATFTLYSINHAALDQFWPFFWKYYPLDSQEYIKISC